MVDPQTQRPTQGQAQGGAWGVPPTAQEMSPESQRTWALVAHLSHLAGSLVILPAVGPLIVYLVVKDRGLFVRRQAAEALNFQLLLLAVYLVVGLGTALTLGLAGVLLLPLAGIAAVIGLVFTIVAAIKAFGGLDYRYPISWRLVH